MHAAVACSDRPSLVKHRCNGLHLENKADDLSHNKIEHVWLACSGLKMESLLLHESPRGNQIDGLSRALHQLTKARETLEKREYFAKHSSPSSSL